jgi:CRISPR-associated protein Cas2
LVIISYDISNDKKRRRFARYLSKFGHRLQYSVFEIENSERILNNIIADLNNKYMKVFEQTDSVYVFRLNPSCEIIRYGYAKNEESNMLIVK